ncbi:MAG: PilZ domain-containing protein [Sphingomonas sp.]
MDPVEPDQSGDTAAGTSAQQRQNERDSLLLTAQLRIAGTDDAEQVRVRNLSAGGLMAELPYPIEPDTAVEVEVRGIGWISGRVAWTAVGRAGIAFDEEVDPKKARKPVGGGAKTPVYVKPILKKR